MAVHTILNREDIKEILKLYSIGNLKEFRGITEGIENTNYFLKTTKDNYILTIYESRVKIKDLPFYFDLMNYIKSKGINCPQSISNNNDKRLETIKKKKLAIFTFIKGKCLDIWDKNDCYSVGKELGKLHSVSNEFKMVKKNDFGLRKWISIFNSVDGDVINLFPEINLKISDELNFLKKNWKNTLPKGIIHADLFPDNVLFRQRKISGIIDFYFSCVDSFIYDLCITINAWCFKKKKFEYEYFTSLIRGYESERKITSKEKLYFNTYLRGAAMRFLLTRLLDYNKKEKNFKKKDPIDFINILNFHIKNNLSW